MPKGPNGQKRPTKAGSSDADFAGIMAGLTAAVEIVQGRADPATYRVHHPKPRKSDAQGS